MIEGIPTSLFYLIIWIVLLVIGVATINKFKIYNIVLIFSGIVGFFLGLYLYSTDQIIALLLLIINVIIIIIAVGLAEDS